MTNSLARTNGGRTQGGSRAVRWTPYQDLFGFDPFQALRSNWAFDYDVSKTETGYEVEVPVPGYNPEQIDVTFKDGVLSVNGKGDRRTFSRSFSVPEDVDNVHFSTPSKRLGRLGSQAWASLAPCSFISKGTDSA